MGSSILRFVANFAEDDQGQDLVEYVLLGAFVAVATLLGLKAIRTTLGTGYTALDSNEQNLWQPPSPPTPTP